MKRLDGVSLLLTTRPTFFHLGPILVSGLKRKMKKQIYLLVFRNPKLLFVSFTIVSLFQERPTVNSRRKEEGGWVNVYTRLPGEPPDIVGVPGRPEVTTSVWLRSPFCVSRSGRLSKFVNLSYIVKV